MALTAVILDLDGVIADSHPLHEQAWKTLLAEQGLDPASINLDFIYAGRPRREILRYYLGPLPEEQLESLGRRKDELYSRLADALKPKPGLLRLLDELDAAGIPFAVATCAGRKRAEDTLRQFGIAERFAAVVTGEDAGSSKPTPEIFLLAAAKLQVSPRQALVIEDSLAGIEAARAAGMKCVAYVPAARLTEFAEAGADRVLTDFPRPAVEFFLRLMEADAAPPFSSAAHTAQPPEGA
jgi:beta-phosphoglucomutase